MHRSVCRTRLSLTTHAVKVGGKLDLEADDAVLGVALLDLEGNLAGGAGGVALEVHVAGVRPLAVVIALGNVDIDGAALCDLRDGLVGQGDLGVLAYVHVAGQQCPAALVDNVLNDLILVDDVGVGLGRVDCKGCKLSNWGEHEVRTGDVPSKPLLAGPFAPWARRITPWPWATAKSMEATRVWRREGIVSVQERYGYGYIGYTDSTQAQAGRQAGTHEGRRPALTQTKRIKKKRMRNGMENEGRKEFRPAVLRNKQDRDEQNREQNRTKAGRCGRRHGGPGGIIATRGRRRNGGSDDVGPGIGQCLSGCAVRPISSD